MTRLSRLWAALGLTCALAATLFSGPTALGQSPGQAAATPPAAKRPVQGYTRINKKTGQPVKVPPVQAPGPAAEGGGSEALRARRQARGGTPTASTQRSAEAPGERLKTQ